MTAFFLGPIARTHALAPADRREREAKAASQRQCDRCCATAKAMEYVRHQWVVAGIDKGE